MLDDMRKFVQDRVESLGAPGAEELAGSLMSRAQGLADQLSGLAAGFLAWSAEARASMTREVKGLVSRQIEEMGLATKADVHSLRERLDRLEARAGKPKPRTAAKRASSRRAPARQGVSRSRSRSSAGGTPSSRSRGTSPKPTG